MKDNKSVKTNRKKNLHLRSLESQEDPNPLQGLLNKTIERLIFVPSKLNEN